MTYRAVIFVLSLCLTACLGTGSGNPIGALECVDAAYCEATCPTYVEDVERTPEAFTGTSCEMVGLDGGPSTPSCDCARSTGGHSGFLLAGSGCLAYGASRRCIYAAEEFPGCDPADRGSCTSICDDLHRRELADIASLGTPNVRAAHCREPGYCRCILEIRDGCFVNESLEAMDCALSDGAMIDRYESGLDVSYPPCSMSMGAGTCWID